MTRSATSAAGGLEGERGFDAARPNKLEPEVSDNDETAKSLREFQIVFRNILLEGFDKSLRILMLGNSGGLALTIGIAGALVGGGSSPLPTLWPALFFCAGLLVSTAQPILATWRLYKFREVLEVMLDPTADLTELEKDANEELRKSSAGYQVYRRLPSFVPVLASALLFLFGLVGGFVSLYYL